MVKLRDSKGNPLNFIIDESDTLIIRKADRHLWTLFSKGMLDGEKINGVKFNCMLVLGPEGVGKVNIFFNTQKIKHFTCSRVGVRCIFLFGRLKKGTQLFMKAVM